MLSKPVITKFWSIGFTVVIFLTGNTLFAKNKVSPIESVLRFHSYAGQEHVIRFNAIYLTEKSNVENLIATQDEEARTSFVNWNLRTVLPYLMGPTTHRTIGGPKRLEVTRVDWANIQIKVNQAFVPYTYEATWLLNKEYASQKEFQIPVPLNAEKLVTTH